MGGVPDPGSGQAAARVASALVIAGSDKRGTIYGIYDLPNRLVFRPGIFGPTVPVVHKDALFVKAGNTAKASPR